MAGYIKSTVKSDPDIRYPTGFTPAHCPRLAASANIANTFADG